MDCFRIVVFPGVFRTLEWFSKIVFVVLKILHNFFSAQSFCLQITANVSKISKSIHRDIVFILPLLSETVNVFV